VGHAIAVEHTVHAIAAVVQTVPVGTNIAPVHLLWVMLNGSTGVHAAGSAAELGGSYIVVVAGDRGTFRADADPDERFSFVGFRVLAPG
jgi:hypothetical protein